MPGGDDAHLSLIRALRSQRQVISEFEASQVYRASFRTLKAYTTCDLFLNVIHIMIKYCFIKLITELILYLLDIKDTSKFLFIFLYVFDTCMYVCSHMWVEARSSCWVSFLISLHFIYSGRTTESVACHF